METKIYFRDMEGYEALTEHQKKYIGKNAAFDLEKLPARAMQEEMDGFIQERMRKVAITTLQTDKTNYNLLWRKRREDWSIFWTGKGISGSGK